MSEQKIDRQITIIQALDPEAHLKFSPCTSKWYVAAGISISNGAIISGITEHRDTPDGATEAFLARLVSISPSEVLVTEEMTKDRRHWRWNGHAWTDASDRIPTRVS